eukprot:4941077-Lingulodinium_polyedra.AAC.1
MLLECCWAAKTPQRNSNAQTLKRPNADTQWGKTHTTPNTITQNAETPKPKDAKKRETPNAQNA